LSSAPKKSIVDSTTAKNLPARPAVAAEERFVTIDGARMRYLQAGSGRPLILLHGLMGYSFSWRFTIPALARNATVYAPDQLGTGFSDRPAELDCRLCAMADRLFKFLDAVGVSSFDLLGTSHGGAVAMMAASMRATRPDLHLRSVNYMSWTFPYWLARLYGDSKRIPPGTLEGYQAPVSIPGSFEYAVGIVSHWTNDLRELEHAIPKLADIPTLLVWGSADPAVYVQSAEQLRRHFKHCEVVVYPGVGHLPYEEAPEQFSATVLEFLKGS
jgi:pimeloyl-ACP methyl ester carboxylesterase